MDKEILFGVSRPLKWLTDGGFTSIWKFLTDPTEYACGYGQRTLMVWISSAQSLPQESLATAWRTDTYKLTSLVVYMKNNPFRNARTTYWNLLADCAKSGRTNTATTCPRCSRIVFFEQMLIIVNTDFNLQACRQARRQKLQGYWSWIPKLACTVVELMRVLLCPWETIAGIKEMQPTTGGQNRF